MPMIHNRIYGEVALWTLPSREFRLLVPPMAVITATRENLLDIDALDVFLQHASCIMLFTISCRMHS